jgi:hypothetical protein
MTIQCLNITLYHMKTSTQQCIISATEYNQHCVHTHTSYNHTYITTKKKAHTDI